MTGMGFSLRWCVEALVQTGDQGELAVEWLLQNSETLASRDLERRRRKAVQGDATRTKLDQSWYEVAAKECRESSRGHFDALQGLVSTGGSSRKAIKAATIGTAVAAAAATEAEAAAAEAAESLGGEADRLAQHGANGWWLAYVRGGEAKQEGAGEMRILTADAADHLTSRGRQAALRWMMNKTSPAGSLGGHLAYGSESDVQRAMLGPWQARSLLAGALRQGTLALAAVANNLGTQLGLEQRFEAIDAAVLRAAAAAAKFGGELANPSGGTGTVDSGVGGWKAATRYAGRQAGLPWDPATSRTVAELAHRSFGDCGAGEAARKQGATLGADVLTNRSVQAQLRRATLAVLPPPPVPSAQATAAAVVAAAALQLTPSVVRPRGDATVSLERYRGYTVSHHEGGPMVRQAVALQKDPLATALGLAAIAGSAAESEALATKAHARGSNRSGRALELAAMAKGAATHARTLRVQARWLMIRAWATAVGGSAPLLDFSAGSGLSRAMADLSSRDARAMLPPAVRAFLWAEGLALTARAREPGSAVSCGAQWQNGKQDPRLAVDRRLARVAADKRRSAMQRISSAL